MTQLHLVGVIVRVFALYVAVSTLQTLPSTVAGAVEFGAGTTTVGFAVALIAAPLLASILLWVFHLAVARKFFFGNAGFSEVGLNGAEHLESALFSVLGLWFCVSGSVDLSYWLSLVYIASAPNWNLDVLLPDQKANFIATLVEIVVGVLLLFRGRSFQVLISKIRR